MRPRLSPSDRRVAQLVAEGYTHAEIAEALRRTENGVRVQVSEIAGRIGGNGRASVRITRWWYSQPEEKSA
jgi:DNA-binding NarL/FixJ family response regulator